MQKKSLIPSKSVFDHLNFDLGKVHLAKNVEGTDRSRHLHVHGSPNGKFQISNSAGMQEKYGVACYYARCLRAWTPAGILPLTNHLP
jgi:hypothetical protein